MGPAASTLPFALWTTHSPAHGRKPTIPSSGPVHAQSSTWTPPCIRGPKDFASPSFINSSHGRGPQRMDHGPKHSQWTRQCNALTWTALHLLPMARFPSRGTSPATSTCTAHSRAPTPASRGHSHTQSIPRPAIFLNSALLCTYK
uniref:Uncharacterized protein n=1 Tax=Manihot esculenta TaxID=3983 RepID=A0A2C9UV26_MANES